jgi:hypothetical protein
VHQPPDKLNYVSHWYCLQLLPLCREQDKEDFDECTKLHRSFALRPAKPSHLNTKRQILALMVMGKLDSALQLSSTHASGGQQTCSQGAPAHVQIGRIWL